MDIRTESRATALLTDDEYTVTGVQYTDPDGNVVHVNAKAVILATGGMSTNKELDVYKRQCRRQRHKPLLHAQVLPWVLRASCMPSLHALPLLVTLLLYCDKAVRSIAQRRERKSP